MANLTRKQKKNIRDLITGLSGCTVIAVILIVHSFVNRHEHVPVVFSDILDGAAVTAGTENEEIFSVSLEDEYLYERLFDEETDITTVIPETYAPETTVLPELSEPEPGGAGGTILINTTPKTSPKPETEPTVSSATTKPFTTTPPHTTVRTTASVTKKTTVTTKSTTDANTSSTSKTPFINIGGGTVSEDEKVYTEMLALVNEARRRNGLNELWYSARVHEVATLRAYELSSYYSHSRSDGRGFYTAFHDLGINYTRAGENIAYGRNMFETVEEVFVAWMNSESHRENILNPDYECAGFGLCVLKVGKDTYYYWSQEFATF